MWIYVFNMNFTKKIKRVANSFLKENGSVTTLDIKNQLISNYPDIQWSQNLVSATMDALHKNQLLRVHYTDNGNHRTYYAFKKANKRVKVPVTKTELQKIFMNPQGKFQTVSWIAKDGNKRTYILKSSREMYTNGYVGVYTSKGNFKSVDPRTIQSINANGVNYVKK